MKADRDGFLTELRYPQFQLAEFLKSKSIDYRENDAGDHKEISINCIECHLRGEPTPDRNFKLWINPKNGFFNCYRCGWSGTLIWFLRALLKISFEDAIKILRGKPVDPMGSIDLRLFDDSDSQVWTEQETQIVDVELPYGYEPIEGPHPYLKKRGIPWQWASDQGWGVGVTGFVKDRLIIPFLMNDRLVFWQARATWEGTGKDFKKVLNPKGVSARHVLYNYDNAKSFEEVVLVEGFMDAAKVGPMAMAVNGKMLHPQQVEWLTKTKAKRIVLLFDEDAWTDEKEGKRGKFTPCSIQRATELLRSARFEVVAGRLPRSKKIKIDPGIYPFQSKKLQGVIASAKSPKFRHRNKISL